MAVVRSHEDLIVWQKAMDLTAAVYRVAGFLPQSELYGLRAQLTRAAISVPANIAEGHGRASTRDFIRFLAIARGSLMETRTLLSLSARLGFCDKEQLADSFGLVGEISRMLPALQKSLRSRLQPPEQRASDKSDNSERPDHSSLTPDS